MIVRSAPVLADPIDGRSMRCCLRALTAPPQVMQDGRADVGQGDCAVQRIWTMTALADVAVAPPRSSIAPGDAAVKGFFRSTLSATDGSK
jgi:hypothetical protein